MGAASSTPPSRSPEPDPPSGSFLLVLSRDAPEGVWLRSPQGWARLGWSRLVRGLLPGWTPSRLATPCLPAQQALYHQSSSLTHLPEVLDLTPVGCPKRLLVRTFRELVKLGLY